MDFHLLEDKIVTRLSPKLMLIANIDTCHLLMRKVKVKL